MLSGVSIWTVSKFVFEIGVSIGVAVVLVGVSNCVAAVADKTVVGCNGGALIERSATEKSRPDNRSIFDLIFGGSGWLCGCIVCVGCTGCVAGTVWVGCICCVCWIGSGCWIDGGCWINCGCWIDWESCCKLPSALYGTEFAGSYAGYWWFCWTYGTSRKLFYFIIFIFKNFKLLPDVFIWFDCRSTAYWFAYVWPFIPKLELSVVLLGWLTPACVYCE